LFISSFGGLAAFPLYAREHAGSYQAGLHYDCPCQGLSERDVIYKHALRNALLPAITILGLSIPGLIGGSVIFETIFAIPGMGQLFYMAVMARDYRRSWHFAHWRDFNTFRQFNCRCVLCAGGPAHPYFVTTL